MIYAGAHHNEGFGDEYKHMGKYGENTDGALRTPTPEPDSDNDSNSDIDSGDDRYDFQSD